MPTDYLFAPEGYVGASGEFDTDLGAVRELRDFDPAGTSTLKTLRSAARKTAKWVKNDSGGTLLRGLTVKYKAAYYGLRVGDRCDVGDICDGVVDDMVGTGGVADGSNFWMIMKGPNLLVSDGATTLAVTDIVCTAGTNTGKVAKQTAAPADTTAAMVQVKSVVGRPTAAVTNVDGTEFLAYIERPTY